MLLTYRVVDEGAKSPERLVVLCHGFGAPGDDLVPLASELFQTHPGLRGRARFVFPEAPLSLEGLGMGPARAWWMIDPSDLARLHRMRFDTPEGLPPVRRQLRATLEELANTAKLPLSRVVLGGFSQGAMLTTDLALRLEEAPAGLCILSGTLVSEEAWRTKAAARKGLPVFQSHGRQDPLLPYAAAEDLHQLLVGCGAKADFWGFDGGHTITQEVLRRLGDFLLAV